MLLDHDLTVKHLKRWTFWGLVKTDIFDRGIPWTELILRDRHMPNDLNLQLSQSVSVALAFLLVAVTAAAAIYWRGYFLTPIIRADLLRSRPLLGGCGIAQPIQSPPRFGSWARCLRIVAMAAMHHMFGLIPPLVLSQLLLFSRHRYAESTPQKRRWLRVPALIYLVFSVLACLYYLPSHSVMFCGCSSCAVLLGLLNSQFYLFLASKRGVFFAMAAIPFHMLYHFYNGVSFLAGTVRYWFRPRAANEFPARAGIEETAALPPDEPRR